jgi:hypothetical protein
MGYAVCEEPYGKNDPHVMSSIVPRVREGSFHLPRGAKVSSQIDV